MVEGVGLPPRGRGQAEGPQRYPSNMIMNTRPFNFFFNHQPIAEDLTFEPLCPQLNLPGKIHMQTFTDFISHSQFYHILSTHLKYTRSILKTYLF